MKNVDIKLETNLWQTDRISSYRYTIFINGTKHISGFINPWYWNLKTHWYHNMSNIEVLNKIKEMYYWLF